MFKKVSLAFLFAVSLWSTQAYAASSHLQNENSPSTFLGQFDTSKDLLLAQFDSKTDVDDIHTIAAVATMLRHPQFAQVKFHAVAGAYGIQEGLYVPAPELFALAFADNWSNAHVAPEQALKEVLALVQESLKAGGDIWIAEAGQSDFSAAMVREIQQSLPDIDTKSRIHLVQHSEWNQDSATPADLAYVQQHSNYHKIADGNATGNGTAGLRTEDAGLWVRPLANKKVGYLWQLAKDIGDKYNGVDGRYNNTAVEKGGLDFSDTAEMCWIFGYDNIGNVSDFFDVFISE